MEGAGKMAMTGEADAYRDFADFRIRLLDQISRLAQTQFVAIVDELESRRRVKRAREIRGRAMQPMREAHRGQIGLVLARKNDPGLLDELDASTAGPTQSIAHETMARGRAFDDLRQQLLDRGIDLARIQCAAAARGGGEKPAPGEEN